MHLAAGAVCHRMREAALSLVRLAHRIATVQALRGRTLAGDRIGDSSILPQDRRNLRPDDPAHIITVYTDDEGRDLRDLTPDQKRNSLWIELEVAATVCNPAVPDEWGLPHTDAGLEITLDLIERQIHAALADEESPWANLWRRLHHGTGERRSVRVAMDQGMRLASRQISIEVAPLPEPPFGAEPRGVWVDFLSLMESDPDLSDLATLVRAEFIGSGPITDWQTVIRSRLMPLDQSTAMLLDPLPEPEG